MQNRKGKNCTAKEQLYACLQQSPTGQQQISQLSLIIDNLIFIILPFHVLNMPLTDYTLSHLRHNILTNMMLLCIRPEAYHLLKRKQESPKLKNTAAISQTSSPTEHTLYMYQGLYGSWKTWKVLEFYYGIFQDWKVLEKGHWSWKVLEIR